MAKPDPDEGSHRETPIQFADWMAHNDFSKLIHSGSVRRDVQVHFVERGIYAGPVDTFIEKFVWRAVQDDPTEAPPIAVLLDGSLRELTTRISRDVTARIIDMSHPDGSRIYCRSLTLLLLAALRRRFPSVNPLIEHSLPFGAYYCTVEGRPPLTADELADVECEMHNLVEQDLPITSRRIPLEEAMDYFHGSGDESKVKLLAHRIKEDLAIYTLDEVQNFFHGYMVPSTGYLRWFGLAEYGPGFLLRFPRRQSPTRLQPIQPSSTLVDVFREYRDWMRKMGLQNLGSLNDAILDGRMSETVLISEAFHERRIAHIANIVSDSWQEANDRPRIRAVLVAGPSSSGKTTFAKRLGIQLLSYGIRPYALSLDNYFVNRQETPLDEFGNYDFEALQALDLVLLNKHLSALLAGEEVSIPRFNFRTGQREVGETVQLATNQVLIIEGIHGLNPQLATAVPDDITLRVYVSVLTHLNLDRHNRISTSDVRLLRRIVRDHRHRGYTAADTISHWTNVRRGEERYIFPYQTNADVLFNSALLYELSVLRSIVEPLLLQIERETPAYIEARRLLAFLQWVRSVDADLIPDNSIIREFIGGSILRQFALL